MKIQIIAEFPDYFNEFGYLENGAKSFVCNSIEELYETLKSLSKEEILTHVHINFVETTKVKTFKSKGTCIIPFKEEVSPIISF